jgi:hypothetical protein
MGQGQGQYYNDQQQQQQQGPPQQPEVILRDPRRPVFPPAPGSFQQQQLQQQQPQPLPTSQLQFMQQQDMQHLQQHQQQHQQAPERIPRNPHPHIPLGMRLNEQPEPYDPSLPTYNATPVYDPMQQPQQVGFM